MRVPFLDYRPDEAAFESPGMPLVRNVLPRKSRGYAAMRAFGPYSDALTEDAKGAYAAKAADTGTAVNYVGTRTKLWQLSGVTWTDLTRDTGGDYTEGEYWDFVEWNQYVFTTNLADDPQFATKSPGGKFAKTFGSSSGGENLKAQYMGVVGNFIVYGNLNENGTRAPNAIRWTALADPFQITPDPLTQSGRRELPGSGGPVQRVVGGEWGVILQEKAVSRMDYRGDDLAFDVREIEQARGTPSPMSVIKVGPHIYYLSEDGFYRLEFGASSVNIGEGKVDDSFLMFVPYERIREVRVAHLAQNRTLLWYLPRAGAPANTLDFAVAYNYVADRWTAVEEAEGIQIPYQGVSNFVSPDDASIATQNVDLTPGSPDDPIWAGGVFQLVAIDANRRLALPNTYDRLATFETGESEPNPGNRSLIDAARVLIEEGDIQAVRIGYRNDLSEAVTWEQSQNRADDGRFPFGLNGINARYVRFGVDVTGAFRHALGIDFNHAVSDER